MIPDDVNQELLIGFIDESVDALASTDSLLLKLETSPDDLEVVNAIFRPIHSLKGNSAYFGLMKIKKLAHTMENLLDSIRKGHHAVDRQIVESLLPGIDMLKSMLAEVRTGKPELSDEPKYQKLIAELSAVLHQEKPSTLQSVITKIDDLLRQLESCGGPDVTTIVNELKKNLTAIPALSGVLPQEEGEHEIQVAPEEVNGSSTAADELLRLLNGAPSLPVNSEIIEQIPELLVKMRHEMAGTDNLKIVETVEDLIATFSHADTGIDNLAIALINEQMAGFKTLPPVREAPKTETPTSSQTLPTVGGGAAIHHDKTMRISELTLDEFLHSVGELLGIEEMLRNVLRQGDAATDFRIMVNSLKDTVNQFEGISRDLRARIMAVRKVEAGIFLLKTPRIVHDISSQTGKKIVVDVVGGDLKIDKSYIDLLDAPLTHIVRNAADHGIELPEQRKAAGKDETGKIMVALAEHAEHLQLVVEDDGAGLNYERLQKKAESLGLVEKGRVLSEQDVVDLLFLSGVSTAETITDISGRGVGMDVVKRAVVEVGGRIEVSSVEGQGTKFIITLPRNASTQIIDGYMVRTFDDELYIIPLRYIIEAFAFQRNDIVDVAGKGMVLTRRGSTFPLYYIDRLLDPSVPENAVLNTSDGMAVVVNVKNKSCILAVREIVGIQKIVCKPVEGSAFDIDVFDGAAIAGNGRVSMVINMEKLLI